jgi:hypothetical protein
LTGLNCFDWLWVLGLERVAGSLAAQGFCFSLQFDNLPLLKSSKTPKAEQTDEKQQHDPEPRAGRQVHSEVEFLKICCCLLAYLF